MLIQEQVTIQEKVKYLYNNFGQQKPMGNSALSPKIPHYFLLRSYMGENDLLIILNTKRCRYQCNFCQLPAKSSKKWIEGEDILAQFEHIMDETKHALSIIDRVTIGNEGSVLDTGTLPTQTLMKIAKCIHQLRRVRTLVLETRLEFVDPGVIQQIRENASRIQIQFLTGFETQDPYIRDEILFKNESLEKFLVGLDKVSETKSSLTSYVLYKPSPLMTDEEAYAEAEKTIDYLVENCKKRNIPLSLRLNPMYVAANSKWAKLATSTSDYKPPRLTDIMKLAEKKAQEGVKLYIGLSTEGLDESGNNYMSREDYSRRLLKPIILFNNGKISRFDWASLSQ